MTKHNNSGGVPRRSVLTAGAVVTAATVAMPLLEGTARAAVQATFGPATEGGSVPGGAITVTSPSGRKQITLQLESGTPKYTVTVEGTEVVPPSPLGLTLDDADFTTQLTLADPGRPKTIPVHYELLQGKVSRVRKTMTERVVLLRNAKGLTMEIVLRADSEGVAFRHRFPDRGDSATHTVVSEATGLTLNVPADGGAQYTLPYTVPAPKYQEWYIPRANHTTPTLGTATTSVGGTSFPLLARTVARDGREWWVLASESGMDGSYPACHLQQPTLDQAGKLVTYTIAFPLNEEARGNLGPGTPQVSGAWQTSWRFVAVAETPARLANTTLATDLAQPCAVDDTSWIRPGASTFSWLTARASPRSLEQSIRWFDLAKEMRWPYALVDSRWDQMTDANGNPVPLERIVAEADQRGIKLFLWHNSAGVNNSSASTPKDKLVDPAIRRPYFQKLRDLGIAGIKTDGWESDKQQLIAWQREMLEDAADYRLHVTLHNTTPPRGWDRTYPHLLGVEAGTASQVYTDANPVADQIAEQTTIAAITRNAVGVFDYSPTLLSPYVQATSPRRTTDAHELALTMIYQSGFTSFADSPEGYLTQPTEVRELLSTVPVAFDETRFLAADPGSHVVVARRKGRTWYVAGVNGKTITISPVANATAPDYAPPTGQAQRLTVNLRDLGIHHHAKVQLFADASATDRTLRQTTKRGLQFSIDTAPFGGFIAII